MNKNKSYKCIKSFEIPILNEDGGCTDDYMLIKKGDIYIHSNANTLCGAKFRLINNNEFIEINKERLEQNFKREGK
jgi:hypothetical protein